MQIEPISAPRKFGRRCPNAGESGSALVEFALSLPLIILFVAAIYDLGRVQSQMNTVAQVAYQIAFIGATSPRATGDLSMEQQGAKILSLIDRESSYFNATPTLDGVPGGQTTRYFQEGGKWYVTTSVSGSLNSYFKTFFPPIFSVKVSITAPYLYSSVVDQNSDIDGYQNGTLSDCIGNLGVTIRTTDACKQKICGCPPASNPSFCAGSNTPRVCYELIEPP